jgi:hypothetical protein
MEHYDNENPVYPFRRNAQGTIDVAKLRGNVYSYNRKDLTKFNMVFSPRFSFCLENLCIYEYAENSEAVVDGDNVILPEGQVGRWLKYVCLGATVPVSKEYVDGVAMTLDLLLQSQYVNKADLGEIAAIIPKPDWEQNDPDGNGYIENKPQIPTINPHTVIDPTYVKTDNNFSNTAAQKLSGIEANAQVNKIEFISVNGEIQPILNKQVNIVVPEMESGGEIVGGDGLPEAPSDGKIYGRRDAQWTEITIDDTEHNGTGITNEEIDAKISQHNNDLETHKDIRSKLNAIMQALAGNGIEVDFSV